VPATFSSFSSPPLRTDTIGSRSCPVTVTNDRDRRVPPFFSFSWAPATEKCSSDDTGDARRSPFWPQADSAEVETSLCRCTFFFFSPSLLPPSAGKRAAPFRADWCKQVGQKNFVYRLNTAVFHADSPHFSPPFLSLPVDTANLGLEPHFWVSYARPLSRQTRPSK